MKTQKISRQPTAATLRRTSPRSIPPAHQPVASARQLERAAANPSQASTTDILALQHHYGNRAVQRALAPRSEPVGMEGGEVGPELGRAIEQARGGGQALNH